MGNDHVQQTIKEKGVLLEKDIYDFVCEFEDGSTAARFLDELTQLCGQRMITKNALSQNVAVHTTPLVQKLCVKLGIRVSVAAHVSEMQHVEPTQKNTHKFEIHYSETRPDQKLTVKDFVGHFRSRYQQLQRILLERSELASNMVSIGKLSSDRSNVSIIGIVTEKRVTKNKNLIIRFENLTGEVTGLIKVDREEIFSLADELQLDDIVGIKASGNRDMLFVHDIIFPDAFIPEKTRFEEEIGVAFLSDVHAGSDRHLGTSFERFLEWLKSEDATAQKIKYIFFSGDNVDGVGIFPGQEKVLSLPSMEEQYSLLASYLRKIPTHITMFLCPGQHDATRVAEPQPLVSRRYAAPLYEIENLILVTNPTLVKLVEGDKNFKVLMYHGASIHSFINEIKELRLMKAHRCPAKAVRHMLKRRHLAPTHSEVVYIPNAHEDPLVIREVPDVLCTGEVHRLDIEDYHGVLIITGSCWQSQTPFEEKVGNEPDPCKVPVLNLKTRELKIFDFSDENEKQDSEK